ncbi:MAG: hypothetical protein FJW32_06560 [Acidobacteria bacterium]|nr:hypothetical protein [Acidobacteriota bacterium]
MSALLTSPQEGELVLVRVNVESRHLEDTLESLAALPFPVNPELAHAGLDSTIEFPAYEGQLAAVRGALESLNVDLRTVSMLTAIHGE